MLPERATNPDGEEARLLGPFSLRRLTNIHRKFVREEKTRLAPPLEVQNPVTIRQSVLEGFQASQVALEGMGIIHELESLARSPPRPVPRRQRRKQPVSPSSSNEAPTPQISPATSTVPRSVVENLSQPFVPRFMRRRFGRLLATIPLVSSELPSAEASNKTKKERNKRGDPSASIPESEMQPPWKIHLSPHALTRQSAAPRRSSQVTDTERDWIERSLEGTRGNVARLRQ